MLILANKDGIILDPSIPESYRRIILIGLAHLLQTQQAVENKDGNIEIVSNPYYNVLADTPKSECYGGEH